MQRRRRLARRAATATLSRAPRRAAEQALDAMVRELTAQGMTFSVYPQGGNEAAATTYDPAALFDWCRRRAWGQLARERRMLIQPRRGGKKLSPWTLEVSSGQASGRKTVTAASASAWEPSEFAIHVYPDRPPMATMAGSKDLWIAAALLVLDSSGLDFVRRGGRISGNPSRVGQTLMSGLLVT